MTRYSFSDWQAGQKPPKGWDAADAIADGWTQKEIVEFLRTNAVIYVPAPGAEPKEPEEETKPAPEPPTPPERPPRPTKQAISTDQAKPATVTDIRTLKSYAAEDGWQSQLLMNEEGKLKPRVLENWMLFLTYHPVLNGVFSWNSFAMRLMIVRRPPWIEGQGTWTPREMQDADIARLVAWFERKNMTPTVSTILPAIKAVAVANGFDPLADYLNGLRWDGKQRAREWLITYLGCDDGDYARIVGIRFLISAVARGLRPGCKVDTMMILEGPQGARKSTAWRDLFGSEFFTDEIADVESKDAMMQVQGVWGIEVAEMHKFTQAEANAVKKFLSRQEDRFRPPYERSLISAPRRSVMVGTINPDGTGYLKDPTGARRFWPVTTGQIDDKALRRDRDQIWAEAVSLFNAGNPWWVQPDELDAVEQEQAARTEADPWHDFIADATKGMSKVYLNDVLQALDMKRERVDHKHQVRIGRIMRALGYERGISEGDVARLVYRKVSGPGQRSFL